MAHGTWGRGGRRVGGGHRGMDGEDKDNDGNDARREETMIVDTQKGGGSQKTPSATTIEDGEGREARRWRGHRRMKGDVLEYDGDDWRRRDDE